MSLLDPPDVIRKKIMRATTDSNPAVDFDQLGAGVQNLLTIYQAFTESTADETRKQFEGKRYGDLKKGVAEAVVAALDPIQKRYREIMEERGYLARVLADGAERIHPDRQGDGREGEEGDGAVYAVIVPAPVRVAGWILGDLATALIGTAILEAELEHVFPAHSRADLVAKHSILSGIAALALGYAAYALRPHASAKWLWIAGVVWAGKRIVQFWYESRMLRVVGASHSVYWEMSGRGCEFGTGFTPSCESWLIYTNLAIRMIAYSAGAFFAASSVLGWRAIRERWRSASRDAEIDVDPGE